MSQVEGHCAKSSATVLVVDDAPANIDLLVSILEPHFQLRVAAGGEKALRIVLSDNPPDLVLLDVCMPDMDGFEVCRQIKSHRDRMHIPVIFITAMEEQADEEHGLSLGAQDYIVKPFHSSIVLARVRTQLALYEKARELEQQIVASNRMNEELQSTLHQLGATKDKLAQAERMAAVGAMVAGVAHELNTPIGSGLLAATALEERSKHLEQQIATGIRRSEVLEFVAMSRDATGLIAGNLRRAANLIDNFKRLSMKEARSVACPFDLASFLQTNIDAKAPTLALKGVSLVLSVPGPIAMTGYPDALLEIFGHLIENAVLHGFDQKGNGEIQIVCELDGGDAVAIRCVDNGSGIAAEHMERIFDPFFTTKMGTGSNGLGLNIVHNLVVDVCGGSISVESGPGRTQFLLRLPIQAPQSQRA